MNTPLPVLNLPESTELLMMMRQVSEEDVIVIPFTKIWPKANGDKLSKGAMMDDYVRPMMEELKDHSIYCRPLDHGNFAFSWRYIEREWIMPLLPEPKYHRKPRGKHYPKP